MKKSLPGFCVLLVCAGSLNAQPVQPPDKIYGRLFTDVQMNRIFPDNKTFVDCVPKRDPQAIVSDYLSIINNPAVRFSLHQFVEENFTVPVSPADQIQTGANETVTEHINRLWDVLKRNPDQPVKGSSLLNLPGPYIVPGGRFREIYYWDSYFTMQGLQVSNRYDLIEAMINNFSYLLNTYGHIPNGNRSYYLSRSQPPYFSLMLDILAEKNGRSVYALYRNALQKEYDYFTDKSAPTRHNVTMPDGSVLTRYYDQGDRPRQESFYEDSLLGVNNKNRSLLYRNLRSGAESGWDFSTRWFADGKTLATIQTTNLVPVDLNCLMYHLEQTLSTAYRETGLLVQSNYYAQLAQKRKAAIVKYLFNNADNWFYDYNIVKKALSTEKTIAGITPLYFSLVEPGVAKSMADVVQQMFLKDGGVVTTLRNSGQQWDAPNGWAPLQYIAIQGLENYQLSELARTIAMRWVDLNIKVYKKTGKLMEKYNVEDTGLEAGGGEYPSQDGFGWTNGVLLKLMAMYGIKG